MTAKLTLATFATALAIAATFQVVQITTTSRELAYTSDRYDFCIRWRGKQLMEGKAWNGQESFRECESMYDTLQGR